MARNTCFLFIPIIFLLVVIGCQKTSSSDYDPCDERIQLATIKAPASELSWFPNLLNDVLVFQNTKKQTAKFRVTDYGTYVNLSNKAVEVPCSLDSSKKSKLNYDEAYYASKFKLIEGNPAGINSFMVQLKRYIKSEDPRTNSYADVIELYVGSDQEINNSFEHKTLLFPIVLMNYDFLEGVYDYNSGVYSTADPPNPFRIFYSKDAGIVGFTDLQGVYWYR